MNRDFASSLIQLNNTFYREHAASFSETRHTPWPGWVRTLDTAYRELAGTHKGEPLRIFDLACGNMRFERFLDRTLESMRRADPADPFSADGVEFYAADSCIDLANDDWSHTRHLPYLKFQNIDVLQELMRRNPACEGAGLFCAPACDITVCFGFMHHVPSVEFRVRVLDALVRQTRPGGVIAISFWEFMNDPRMVRKAVKAEERAANNPPFESYDPAQFEEGDHLIGWQNDPHAYRYCHHFDDTEIAELVRGVSAFYPEGEPPVRTLETFSADGRMGNLNRYVILVRL